MRVQVQVPVPSTSRLGEPTDQWLFYTPLVWGETASFGGDIGDLGAVPPVGPGAAPLVKGSGAKPPEAESFLFHNFF